MTRPDLDIYYLAMARLVAWRSTCRHPTGAVLTLGGRVVSAGYNDTPRGTPNCGSGGCPRCADPSIPSGHALDECLCVHAEQNAIAYAGQSEGATLYTLTFPCLTCAKLIVNAGVARVVFAYDYFSPRSDDVLLAARVRVDQIDARALPFHKEEHHDDRP